MKRPEPTYPKRSTDGIARHVRKSRVRGAYLDPMPRAKTKGRKP